MHFVLSLVAVGASEQNRKHAIRRVGRVRAGFGRF